MKALSEIDRLEQLIDAKCDLFRVQTLGEVRARGKTFPIRALVVGKDDPSLPTLGLFGGVHGLERIGSETILAFLESLNEQLKWDQDAARPFENVRIVSIPIINPAGVFFHTRCNGNGVDLMRNSPVEADGTSPWLLGGHRISKLLPYHRGEPAELEVESRALINFVKQEMFLSPASIAIDFHSGFGLTDQLWYPYAKTRGHFPSLPEALKIQGLLERTYPNHVYKIEPQSLNYTTHGDLWDYLYDEHRMQTDRGERVFLPWTLEMGSWNWIRKNPFQLLSRDGFFNPTKPHRRKRILRRHLILIYFFMNVTRNWKVWVTPK